MPQDLGDLILASEPAFGDAVAFQARRGLRLQRVTFREAAERAREVAGWLVARGLVPGDRVAVWSPNMPEYAVLYFGAWLAGLVVVPIDVRTPQDVLHGFVAAADPRQSASRSRGPAGGVPPRAGRARAVRVTAEPCPGIDDHAAAGLHLWGPRDVRAAPEPGHDDSGAAGGPHHLPGRRARAAAPAAGRDGATRPPGGALEALAACPPRRRTSAAPAAAAAVPASPPRRRRPTPILRRRRRTARREARRGLGADGHPRLRGLRTDRDVRRGRAQHLDCPAVRQRRPAGSGRGDQ